MKNLFKYLTISLLICLVCSPAYAQKSKSKSKSKDKEEKTEYPMRVKVWKLDQDYNIKEHSQEEDTSLHMFQVYDYNEKNSISVSSLGNMGTPYISNIFDDREQARKSPVFFLNYMNDYITKPEDTKFYQVNHPYTWLYYATTPKARNGQVVDFTHTQNVNEKFNWGCNIGLVGSKGRLAHQATRDVTLSPQLSYIGKHLSLHMFYKFNKFHVEEYGGINDTVEIRNNRFTTLLETPYSNWGRRTWGFIGEYSLGSTDFKIINDSTRTEIYTPRIAFNYILNLDKIYRTYEDDEKARTFYEEYYNKTTATYDSLYFHRVLNKFQLKICENQYTPGLMGALGFEADAYNNFNVRNYLSKGDNETKLNSFFEGSISKNKSKNLILNGSYRQYYTGYNAGDMYVKGNLGFKLFKGESDTVNIAMKASVDFKNETPTYFEKKYYSNNYQWDNDFSRSNILRLGGEIAFPRWHARIGASYYILNNYVYISPEAKPKQMDSEFSVKSISLMKDFYVWHLRFANRITFQDTKKREELNLPKFALYHSTYLEFYLVKNVLLTQIGGEVRYSDRYNAFGYSPATSLFYPSSRISAGEYPIINGFANIKIRGVLMFFKWEHIDDGFIKDWYSSADNYPIQDFHFMFGILWRFGD